MTSDPPTRSTVTAHTLWVRAEAPRAVVQAHLDQIIGRFRAEGWWVALGGEMPDPGHGALAVLDDPWVEPLPEVARWLAEARGADGRWRLPRVNDGPGSQRWSPRGGPYTPFDFERLVGRVGRGRVRARRLRGESWCGFAVAPPESGELLAKGWPPPRDRRALVEKALVFRYGDPALHDREELDPWIDDSVHCLVDVGCGHGRFGERHRRPDRRVLGIEPDWPLARVAQERLDVVLPTTACQGLVALRPATVDRVIFADVLEHTLDPARVLRAARRVLTSDGLAVCSLPNNAWAPMTRALAAGRWDPTLAGTQARDHFVAFTRASFETLAQGCGFEVVDRRPVHAPLDLRTRLWAWLAARTAGGDPADLMAMQWIVVLRPRSES